jgi:hypothetical protein
MFTRPPLRAVLATTAAAGLLVGGANLASYAATHHGHSSGTSAKPHAQPKTIAYHLGSPGQAMGNTRLFSAKVPKGTYEVSISGWLSDDVSTTGDSVTCVLADKKALFHLLNHPGSLTGAQRFYAITGGSEDKTYDFAVMDNSNPVAKIDRRNISYGCLRALPRRTPARLHPQAGVGVEQEGTCSPAHEVAGREPAFRSSLSQAITQASGPRGGA